MVNSYYLPFLSQKIPPPPAEKSGILFIQLSPTGVFTGGLCMKTSMVEIVFCTFVSHFTQEDEHSSDCCSIGDTCSMKG